MPMHLRLDPAGRIIGAGPTIRKVCGLDRRPGAAFLDVFNLRRPRGVGAADDLARMDGTRLRLNLRAPPGTGFKGRAVSLRAGGGMVVNLSFDIGVAESVRRHGLTDRDFAPTDLTIEMLYLTEAKTAVLEELRSLNLRLQSAKSLAEEQAFTDTLTGLANRRAMDHVLALLRAQQRPFALMHLDLDHFKRVNDTLGHAAGDHVLQVVAGHLRDVTRDDDTVVRLGGDEFAVVLPAVSDYALLERIAGRLIERLGPPIPYPGGDCDVSVSVGASVSADYAHPEPEQMLRDADRALYDAKHAGRGRFRTPQAAAGKVG